MLSRGDTNIYALFVERGLSLLKPDGILGLLVPSGIAADKGAAEFFRSVSTTGRLGAFFDFENRPAGPTRTQFFPDVYYRFKFAALIVGGFKREFESAACAFFQTDANVVETIAFTLKPDDFLTVNPNTATAPIFRSPLDAELTLSIYRSNPVLIDRRGAVPRALWPVRYVRMFDMANDAEKFLTKGKLEELGAYRADGRIWKKATRVWGPLYEGKTGQAYDHRAASIILNKGNRYREAMPVPATIAQHVDVLWLNEPRSRLIRARSPARRRCRPCSHSRTSLLRQIREL